MIIRAPRCPGCDQRPLYVIGGQQAFCGNKKGCKVISWDVFDDPATFKAKAVQVDLSGLAELLPDGVEIADEGPTP